MNKNSKCQNKSLIISENRGINNKKYWLMINRPQGGYPMRRLNVVRNLTRDNRQGAEEVPLAVGHLGYQAWKLSREVLRVSLEPFLNLRETKNQYKYGSEK